jgi:uncharacterized protein DUF1566
MGMTIFISWFILAAVMGAIAQSKGKSFGLWFILSVLLSPLVAGFCLVITLMPSSSNSNGSAIIDDFEEKWSTLTKYDEGTKNAVKQIEVYGSDAIDELKKVLRATNDLTRLPIIADQIAKDFQIKIDNKNQKLAAHAAREIQKKIEEDKIRISEQIEADKIRISEQIAKEANNIIWRKRARYALFGIIVLCIVCGAIVVKNKNLKAMRERAESYTDPQTGLMWAGNGNIAGEKMIWNNALSWAKSLNYGGYSDWRLPSGEEFEAFAKRGGPRPSEWFNRNGFNNVQVCWYWSSSTYANGTDSAWGVNMYDGFVDDYDKASSNGCVWPVRSGQF